MCLKVHERFTQMSCGKINGCYKCVVGLKQSQTACWMFKMMHCCTVTVNKFIFDFELRSHFCTIHLSVHPKLKGYIFYKWVWCSVDVLICYYMWQIPVCCFSCIVIAGNWRPAKILHLAQRLFHSLTWIWYSCFHFRERIKYCLVKWILPQLH